MDVTAFAAVSSGLHQSYQLLKAAFEMGVDASTSAKMAAVLRQLGEVSADFAAAQAAHLACVQHTLELEQEVARLKAFEAERERYVLQQVGLHAFAYAVRPGHEGEEPPHYLCQRCYQESVKAVLQLETRQFGTDVLVCHRCQSKVLIPNDLKLEPLTTGRGDPWIQY